MAFELEGRVIDPESGPEHRLHRVATDLGVVEARFSVEHHVRDHDHFGVDVRGFTEPWERLVEDPTGRRDQDDPVPQRAENLRALEAVGVAR